MLNVWIDVSNLQQPLEVRTFYRLTAEMLNEVLIAKYEDSGKFNILKQLFTSRQWISIDDAKSTALDKTSDIGKMVQLFWLIASNGQKNIASLTGDVRFSFATVASCLEFL